MRIVYAFVGCMVLAYDKPGWVTFLATTCLCVAFRPEPVKNTYQVIR